jgi:hypothetical protein
MSQHPTDMGARGFYNSRMAYYTFRISPRQPSEPRRTSAIDRQVRTTAESLPKISRRTLEHVTF